MENQELKQTDLVEEIELMKEEDFELKVLDFTINRSEENIEVQKSYFQKQLDLAKEEPETFLKKKIYWLKKLEAEKKMIKEYQDELKTRLSRVGENIEFHKTICYAVLDERKGEKLEGSAGRISFRKSKQVVILDENEIDRKFIVEKTTESIDKKAIGDTIKAGEVVDGAILQENQSVQIKG